MADAANTPDILKDTVNKWFEEKVKFREIARNTEAYNQVFAAKDDLLARLTAVWPAGAEARPTETPKPAARAPGQSAAV